MEPGASTPRTPDGRPLADQPRWRRDFPIDVPEDAYVARRDFAKFSVLVSAAFATGQIWLLLRSLFRKRRAPGAPPVRVAAVADVPVGGAIAFRYPTERDPCLLVRPSADEFVAYGSECTHLMCAVLPEVEKGRLRCPCHRGYFDLATGRPIAGPPRRRLPVVTLDVRDGNVWATGVRLEAEQ
jgi:nitrite reductase/ring-hydroxylating ferredoxin subunit